MMKVTCQRDKLAAAFGTAASVAPGRSPKPILQNVKLEVGTDATTLAATDLEIGVRVTLQGVEVEAPGSAVLPVKRFGDIVRESSDEQLRLESDGQSLTVWGQHSEFRLPVQNPDEFPAVSGFAEDKYHEVPARLLREIVRRTAFATDQESTRYALGGVLLEMLPEKIIAVGTDGRRLAKMEGPAISVGGHATGDNMVIVPTRAMQLIERALSDADAEVSIAYRGNSVLVKSPRVTISSTLVAGRYPKWRDVFPSKGAATQISLLAGPLHTAVRQAAIVTSEESRGVDFTFGDGELVLTARAAETGQSRVEMPIPYDGEKIPITLDPGYLSDFLRVLEPECQLTLHLTSSESAAVLYTEDGYAYVIMPLARER
jgi:DNA polymerase-3 subunit beta